MCFPFTIALKVEKNLGRIAHTCSLHTLHFNLFIFLGGGGWGEEKTEVKPLFYLAWLELKWIFKLHVLFFFSYSSKRETNLDRITHRYYFLMLHLN